MDSKLKYSKVLYLLLLLFLISYLFLNNKNIFLVFENKVILNKKNNQLLSKKKEMDNLEQIINDFKNKKEFRELLIKEKLYYREGSEKIIQYELEN